MVTNSERWIRRYHPAPDASTRLVCFPHAGGSATYYHPVSRALSPEIDVVAVQYPGRQERRTEPLVDSIEELADLIVPELEPWIDRPLTFFGHSMGASLAYEVALRLEARGTTLLGLFASGRRAPSRWRDERVHQSGDEGLLRELRGLSGTDPAVLGDEDVLRMILPAVRSDYRAAETYRPQQGPRLGCPVVVMIGNSDPKVSEDEARSWAEHTAKDTTFRFFDGGHFYLNSHAPEVLREIRQFVAERAAVAAK
ncbi:alpha/beta fold hydrolase [Streptomyces sp. DSM 3412]|uniref:Alpha/beta fold hydrolase n=1 Tax=Streptomyces gottesmaniae TaxID=3075518 RepID=A0ABU2Z887_9ACTN|nr:alpha/beta fold hydrolase [Streptomyces sp. DSM 3412]MDT0571844.1 alpha/beta fold hydrolase [Streptomyces sp. DSM 3412]